MKSNLIVFVFNRELVTSVESKLNRIPDDILLRWVINDNGEEKWFVIVVVVIVVVAVVVFDQVLANNEQRAVFS